MFAGLLVRIYKPLKIEIDTPKPFFSTQLNINVLKYQCKIQIIFWNSINVGHMILTRHTTLRRSMTRFFCKQRYFLTQPQCCLTFSWIELQVLLRCCLIYITIIILRHILYLVYLCPCLGLNQFMSYLCDSFFFFFNFQPHFQCHWSHNAIKANALVFSTFFRMSCLLLFLVHNVDEESK